MDKRLVIRRETLCAVQNVVLAVIDSWVGADRRSPRSGRTFWRLLTSIRCRAWFCTLVAIVYPLCEGRLEGAQPRFLFGIPSRLPEPLNHPDFSDSSPTMTADGLELFFSSRRNGTTDIFVSKRLSRSEPFTTVTQEGLESISRVDSAEGNAYISADGLELHFISTATRPGNVTPDVEEFDLWVARRSTRSESFGVPEHLSLSTDTIDNHPSTSSDGLTLYYVHLYQQITLDIYTATRATRSDPWGNPTRLLDTQLNLPNSHEEAPRVSDDGLSLFFTSDRGGHGSTDLFVATRASTADPWGRPANLGATINSTMWEYHPFLSHDGTEFLFIKEPTLNSQQRDMWRSELLSFDTVSVPGNGGVYLQNFDTLGTDSETVGIGLPQGWTFTSNDVAFSNVTNSRFSVRSSYPALANGGADGSADRTPVTSIVVNQERGELDLRVLVTDAPTQYVQLAFDLEVWQVFSGGGATAAFQVIMEADTGSGFVQVADLGTISSVSPLTPPTSGTLVDGNDPAYRVTFDSGPVSLQVPAGAVLRTRWIGTNASRRSRFGVDNVSLQFLLVPEPEIAKSVATLLFLVLGYRRRRKSVRENQP